MSRSLLRSLSTIGSFTLLSRILGFVRDVVIAQYFGAGAAVDAFLVAFKIPNFMRRLFAEGAFSQAFIPILSEYKTQREHKEVQDLLAHTVGSLGLILSLVTLFGLVFSPLVVMIFAPGFTQNPEQLGLTADLLRLTFPYLLFISLTAFASAVLNTYGRFAVPAFTPVLLNVCLISAAWGFSDAFEQPIMALAWGVLLAGIVQFLFQLPFVNALHLLVRPRLASPIIRGHEGVRRIFKLMLPALFGVSVTQISLLIDTLMASLLVSGSVSWLYYSDRLLEFPVGIFGVALATVLMPRLSKLVAAEKHEDYQKTLDWGLRLVFLVCVPATLGLMWLAEPILATLFNYGEFSQHDVEMSARSLVAYAIGLSGFVLIKILASGFFSRQDTKTPVKIAVVAMVSNITLNLIFIVPLAHAGLALATALSATINASLLFWQLHKQNIYSPLAASHWRGFLAKILIASVLMSVWLWWGTQNPQVWWDAGAIERSARLMGWIGSAITIYFVSLQLMGLSLKSFFSKKSI